MEKASSLLNKELCNKSEIKKKERKEEKEENKIKEPKTQILENDNTIIIPNTTKIQPKKAKMAKYEFEYDEADNISDVIEDDEE